jgi:molybdopterin converting factor small subunit
MTKIQVQVFAVLKDYFKPTFELKFSAVTIGELKAELEKMNPDSKKVLQACRFVVDENFVSYEYNLKENDKVVVIPPSSGG